MSKEVIRILILITPILFNVINVIRRDLVLTVYRNQFSLFKSFSNYFRILILIPAERELIVGSIWMLFVSGKD